MSSDHRSLEREIARYNGLEVAGLCACLELLPTNANHADRLAGLAATAIRVGLRGRRSPRRSDLVRWLHDSPSLHTGPAWDPHEGPFTEPITFFGGGYVLPAGDGPECVFDLALALDAFVGRRVPLEQTALNRHLMDVSLAGLRLGSHACSVAGLPRWAPTATSAEVDIPPEDVLEHLRGATGYARAELEDIVQMPADALAAITLDVGDVSPSESTYASNKVCARPLLRQGDRFLLVEPGALASAIRHALVSALMDAGMRSDAVEWLAVSALQGIEQAAERMDWVIQSRLNAPDAPVVSLAGGFDVDKAFVITVLYEDLDGYSREAPERPWDARTWVPAVERAHEEMERRLVEGPGAVPNEVLHVVVLAGCGRPSVFGLGQSQGPLGAPRVLLTLENFSRISLFTHDSLLLWKYARAGERLRDECHVLALGPLDEFAAWSVRQSYYMDDDVRPTFVQFDASNARDFRLRTARRRDVHSVVSPQRFWVEVIRVHDSEDIPIYGVLHDLRGQPTLLVEGAAKPIWLQGPSEYSRPEHRVRHAEMIDCLAYWFWQVTDSLSGLAASGLERLVVSISLDEPDVWLRGTPERADGPVATTRPTQDGLQVAIHPALIASLDRADNLGERLLLRAVLEGLDELLEGGLGLNPHQLSEVIDRHAPLGPKKKINIFSPDADWALVPGDLPSYRPIQEAESERLLEELGAHLANEHLLPVGPIAAGERVKVLNQAVAFHYRQLQREVATLSPSGLLEQLIRVHEGLVQREVLEGLMIGSRIAAFGETAMIDQLRLSIPESSRVAVALRFLLEFVAAQPPQGLRPLSKDGLDRLLAICGEIITRGMTSDVIHHGLEDTEVTLLGSRWLGTSKDGRFHAGQQTYLDSAIPARVRAMASRYADAWNRGAGKPPTEVDALEAAAKAEWGFSLREIFALLTTLGGLAYEGDVAVACFPRGVLTVELATRLSWPSEAVEKALEQFILPPRLDFLSPPDGHEPRDVWPWRFNRRLSYLRRPILIRQTDSGEELVWGVRHSEQAARFLLGLIFSERLEARSREMKQFMTRLRQDETRAFVALVSTGLAEFGMAVATNVKKVAGHHIRRRNNEDLGDLDVLAADSRTKRIYAFECKDLEGARTPAELANELSTVFRSWGKDRSAADRQLERVAWLVNRKTLALEHLGLGEDASQWEVAGAIVIDVPVLSPHVADCPLPVFTWRELQNHLESDMSWPGTQIPG